jgi:hypothetical protein
MCLAAQFVLMHKKHLALGAAVPTVDNVFVWKPSRNTKSVMRKKQLMNKGDQKKKKSRLKVRVKHLKVHLALGAAVPIVDNVFK